MLELKNIKKTFSKGTLNEHTALKNINLTVNNGDFITIVGSNGAGKSTLFNAISGSFWVDSGRIFLDEKDITFMKEHKRASQVGRVFQDPMKGTAPNLTIAENLALAYSRSNKNLLNFALNKKDSNFFREELAKFDMGLEDRMETKVGLLSGGQRQVVTLMMCTMVTPKLLMLDEHTAALDPKTAGKVMEITKNIVKGQSLTTMMVTHNMQSAIDTGNRLIMMDSGEILFDIGAEEKKNLTLDKLLKMYSARNNKEFNSDRALLS